jgi:menaquinol-cytochrome c reductase iron-sulfur subunit
MDRRDMLSRIVALTGLAVAGVVAVPAAVTALSPLFDRRRGPVWRPIGPLADFEQGAVREAHVEIPRRDWAQALRTQAVYVWHSAEAGVVVFSRKCTDLGCPIVWDPGSAWFFCPCHGGIFAQNGEPVAGPPKRPLYRFAHRIVDGVVEIDLNSLPPRT